MAFSEEEIKQLAEIREQEYVQVFINKKPAWLLVDELPCTLSTLMASSGTDTWEAFQLGQLSLRDKNSRPVKDDVMLNWKDLAPLHITRHKRRVKPRPQLFGLPAAFHKEDDDA